MFACAAAGGEELDLVVGALQFLLQTLDHFPLVDDLLCLLVDIDVRHVVDFLSAGGVVERGDVFIDEHVEGRETGNHQCVAIAAETLLKNGCKLALAVGNVLHFF